MKEDYFFCNQISLLQSNIRYYQQMVFLTDDPYQKMLYENLLCNAINQLYNWNMYYQNNVYLNKQVQPNQREFTLEKLAQYDGSAGRPAYVAVNGTVYDVTLEATWGGGTHFSLYAGRDLTRQFMGCHSRRPEILLNLPQVGVLRS